MHHAAAVSERQTLALPETDDPRLAELAKEMEPLYEGTNPREHLQ